MHHLRWIGILWLVLILPTIVAAQSENTILTETFEHPDGTLIFSYPEGWLVESLPQTKTLRITNNESAFLSFTGAPDQLIMDLTVDSIGDFSVPPDYAPATTPLELIEAHRSPFASLGEDVFPVSEVEEFTLDGREGATYSTLGKVVLAYYAVALDDETTAFFSLMATKDTIEQWEAIAFDILATIEVHPPAETTLSDILTFVAIPLPLSETYTAPDEAITFNYPEGWETAYMPTMMEDTLPIIMLGSSAAVISKSPGGDGLEANEVQIQIIAGASESILRPMVDLPPSSAARDILQAFLDLNPNPIDVEIVDTTSCGYPAARVDTEMNMIHNIGLVIDYGDGRAVFFAAFVAADVATQWESTILAIAETIRFSSESPSCEN